MSVHKVDRPAVFRLKIRKRSLKEQYGKIQRRVVSSYLPATMVPLFILYRVIFRSQQKFFKKNTNLL